MRQKVSRLITGDSQSAVRTGLMAFVLLLSSPAAAEEPASMYDRANRAYFDGEYGEAASLYQETLTELGRPVPALLYNLGNCNYRTEQYGKAVYYYERALLFAGPATADRATLNLDKTKTALRARYKKELEKGLFRYDESHGIWYVIFTLVDTTPSLVAFLLLSLLMFASLFVWTFVGRPAANSIARTVFLSVLVPTLVLGALHFGRIAVESNCRFGVVVSDDAMVRDAPDEDAPGSRLPEGLEVRILLHNEAGFYKLELSDGSRGYAGDSKVWALDSPPPHP